MQILDLRDLKAPRREALARNFFESVYVPEFPESDMSEDPGVWLPLMEGAAPSGQPAVDILLAVEGEDLVIGGLIMEHYMGSDCWLLTYLVVHPAHRQHGLGAQLIASAVSIAGSPSNEPALMLAETEDPKKMADDAGRHKARERLHILDRLGFRKVGLNYIQPALAAGKRQVSALLLLCLVSAARQENLPATRIVAFLREFYAACGAADDPYLTRVEAEISNVEHVELTSLDLG